MEDVLGTGTRGFGVGVRPARWLVLGTLGTTLALSTASCSESEVSEALVYVQNDGPQAPEYLLFSWLNCNDYIRRDDCVPGSGRLARTANPVATILVQLDTSEPTRRGVFIRGMVAGSAVSSGRAVMDIRPGVRSEVTVQLTGAAVASSEAAALASACPEPPPTQDAGPPPVPDAKPDIKADAAPEDSGPTPDRPAMDTAPPDTTPPMPIELDRGLVGHWPFDEATGNSTPDRSGFNNSGSLIMGPSMVTGRIGAGALDMPGMLDLVEVRDPADGRLDFGSGDFTISVWVRTNQSPAGAPDIVVKWPSSNNGMGPRAGWALTLPQGGLLFKGFSETTAQIGVSGPAVNDGNWHHVVGQRVGNELVLWVDGQQAGTRQHTLGNLSNTAPLWVGGFGTSQELNFGGQLDDVRLYNRVLNMAEIRALATAAGP